MNDTQRALNGMLVQYLRRHRGGESRTPTRWITGAAEEIPAPASSDPVLQVIREELLAKVRDFIRSLPPTERYCVDLSLNGMSKEDIARTISSTPLAVVRATRRGLNKIMAFLNLD